MKGYVKFYRQILESSLAQDPEVLCGFMLLRLLADMNGVLDETYESIARKLNLPTEKVIILIGRLMAPDEESRSKQFDGARIIPLTDQRPWGWRFVNAKKYENLERSRVSARDRKRRQRAREKAKTPSQGVTLRHKTSQNGHRTVTPTSQTNVTLESQLGHALVTGCHKVSQGVTLPTRENVTHKEKEKEKEKGLDGSGPTASFGELVNDLNEAKRLICVKILGGKDPNRPWSYEAQEALSRQLPIPRPEIEVVAWFRGLPTDETPELQARRPVTERGLMVNWGDEVTRARNYWKDCYGDEKEKGAA